MPRPAIAVDVYRDALPAEAKSWTCFGALNMANGEGESRLGWDALPPSSPLAIAVGQFSF